jgi:hypothetical protein
MAIKYKWKEVIMGLLTRNGSFEEQGTNSTLSQSL